MSGFGGRPAYEATQLVRRLPEPDPGRLAAALAEAKRRPIAYALGTGEAEEVALFRGLKPVLRQSHPDETIEAAKARFRAMGFTVRTVAPAESMVGMPQWLLFAGKERDRVIAAARCEVQAAKGHERLLGMLLGYPECCVDAFIEAPQPRGLRALARRAMERAAGPGFARLNALDPSMFHYISWSPCSLRCAPSKAYADAVAACIGHEYGQAVHHGDGRTRCPPGCRHARFVEGVDRALGAHRLLATDAVQVSLTGRFEGGTLHVEHAWATERDRHPSVPTAPAVREAAVRLAALATEAGTVAVVDDQLVLGGRWGGQPVATLEGALLVPFE